MAEETKNRQPLFLTVSRIEWKTQLEHAPTLLKDLTDIGLDVTNHRHVMINTLAGLWKLMFKYRQRPLQVAILDAIPLVPLFIRKTKNPDLLLSTYGDRHIHVLVERFPFTSWVLDLAEWFERVDAGASNIVKSSGKEALEYIEGEVKGPRYVYVPDEFHPFEKKSEVLLYQGNLRWDKGIEAVIDLLKEKDNRILIIVGDGPHRSKLEKYATKLNVRRRVAFTGFQDDPEPFWRIADTVVANRAKTRANAFAVPGLILRAQANGKPFVRLCEEHH